MSDTDRVRYWLPAGLYACAIFLFSATPGRYIPELFPHSDKFVHFLEYLPFGFLLFRAISNTWAGMPPLASLRAAIFVVILYAFSDEIHQLFVPGRQFSLLDMFFDTLGGLAGGCLYLWRR